MNSIKIAVGLAIQPLRERLAMASTSPNPAATKAEKNGDKNCEFQPLQEGGHDLSDKGPVPLHLIELRRGRVSCDVQVHALKRKSPTP